MRTLELAMSPFKQKKTILRSVCSAAVFFTVLGGANYASDVTNVPDLVASETCTLDRCVTDGGFAIEIISNQKPQLDNLAVGDTKAVTESNERVDIYGNFMVRMQNGGVVWATEDPAVLNPQLGVRGPTRLPVKESKILEDARFDVTLNYPAFVKRLELLIFDGNDSDLVSPLLQQTLDTPLTPTKTYAHFDIGQAELNTLSVFSGDELFYIVRAFDAEGRMDETVPKVIQVLDIGQFEATQQNRYLEVIKQGRATPPFIERSHIQSQGNADAQSMRNVQAKESNASVADTPLNGSVLVMQPRNDTELKARVEMRDVAKSFVLTPKFGTRKIDLREGDKQQLDEIIAEIKTAKDLKIQVIGHTDNVRIAPKNRKEFANNHVLSDARAEVVAKYLQNALNLPASQISKLGLGPDQPVASNSTAAGRQKNRRVELQISGKYPVEVKLPAEVVAVNRDSVKLVDPNAGISENIDLEFSQGLTAAENLLNARRGTVDVSTTSQGDLSLDENGLAANEAPALIAARVSENDLRLQNIPVYGSRVRIAGQDVADNYRVQVNDVIMPLDEYGKFAYEYIMPVGEYDFDVRLLDQSGTLQEEGQLNLDVTGKHMFMVALADVTIAQNDVKGSLEQLSVDDRFDEDVFVDGRLAFYLKGKMKGKYLVTAQMDSTEEEIKDVFKNIHRKDPRSVFRRLDPDRYYPVYGDDSTSYSDTDSQGRMYLRVDWDKSRATWGNYNTGVTGTEFGQYNRSLYGAKIDRRSLNTTTLGESKSQVNAFVSEAQSALGHSQFLGTGGSLYYLKHRDILPGSDKVRVEIRDRDSERVLENVTLYRGADYEIDELQGRIILARPLYQITQQYVPSLIKDNPLDGNRTFLLADYEYLPDAFSADYLTAGVRAKQWLGDHIAVGATYIDEKRGNADSYNMAGADITLQAGKGTYLKVEATRTENNQSEGRFLSDDGGLSFINGSNTAIPNQEGVALGLDARVNLKERGWTDNNWKVGAWWNRIDDNYSSSRRTGSGNDAYEFGAELVGEITDRLRVSARGAVLENELRDEDRRYGLQLDYQLSDRTRISGEVASREEKNLSQNYSVDATLAALQVAYSLSSYTDLYLRGQTVLDSDAQGTLPLGQTPQYEDNELWTVGAKHRLNDKANIQAEYSTGDRGDAATVGLEYRMNSNHQVYGTYTHSTDTTEQTLSENQFTLGHRSRLSDQVSVHNESQFVNETQQAGLTHVFGLNYVPKQDWRFGVSYQTGNLERRSEDTNTGLIDVSEIDRQALTVSGGYSKRNLQWSSQIEFRQDEGNGANIESFDQWLTSNRFDYKVNDSWRLLGKATLSETDDTTVRAPGEASKDAQFVEAGLGFAYRPIDNNRWNSLFKYTYLYDLPALDQIDNTTDQRSNILAAETLYQLNQRWTLGAKGVWRRGELRERRNGGDWFEADTRFAALRARYHMTSNWDGMIEYRWLNVKQDDSTRQGLLMSIDRHFGQNFKVGVGYNFTDFSDDLRDLDYDNQGWFINLLGKY